MQDRNSENNSDSVEYRLPMPQKVDLPAHVVKALEQAMVAIILRRPVDTLDDSDQFIHSAFLISHLDADFLITADHVIANILACKERNWSSWLTSVAFAMPDPHPFVFREENMIRFPKVATDSWADLPAEWKRLRNWDLAAMELMPFESEMLRHLGLKPMPLLLSAEEREASFIDEEKTYFGLAGFPESTQKLSSNRKHFSFDMLIVQVDPLRTEMPSYLFKPRWGGEVRLESVAGMSGGPLFAYDDNSVVLVGVQSHESDNRDPDFGPAYLRAVAIDVLVAVLQHSAA